MRILIITGLSGSGKSTAVRALEDEGFFCLDNLPVTLFPTFIELVDKGKDRVGDVALVMDIRGKDFHEGYEKVFQEISDAGHFVEILFFDASDDVLIRRFSETRRRHPVMESGSVPEGIQYEREQLAGLRGLISEKLTFGRAADNDGGKRGLAALGARAAARDAGSRISPPRIA